MTTKPPLPARWDEPFPRIAIDENEGSPFDSILRIATFAADQWTLGPHGPYKTPPPSAATPRGQLREALLHLLELGFLDIDEERLNAVEHFPVTRDFPTP